MTIRVPGPRSAERRAEKERAGVAARLDALDRVLTTGGGRLDPALLAPAEDVARRAGERLRLSGAHTVVALAGATGSGKSSLFNALTGAEVSTVGVRRPTTGVAHASVWGAGGAGELLDWLEVPRRHRVESSDPRLDGLVLLDLPDHDSTVTEHRIEVDRLVRLVDVLIWVLDPQKYADAAVHERYLRPLAGHADVMAVVLNQVDRLAPADVATCLTHLRGLLAEDGLPRVPVLTSSAVAPGGLDDLRAALARAVEAHRAALRRVGADLDAVAAGLAPVVAGPVRAEPGREDARALTGALAAAAGVSAVGAAVQRAYVHRATRSTGSPFTRWLRRLCPDPLRRLHLDRARGAGQEEDGPGPVTEARTSLPAATAVERSRVDHALRTLADRSAEGLPDPWPDALRAAARTHAGDLPDALDRAVATTDLGLERRPLWWRAVGVLQALLAVLALAGGGWLLGLYALTLLRLPEPETPAIGVVPVPTALLLGGLAAGLLLALLARLLALWAARRRRARAEARLRESVAGVAEEYVLVPVRTELTAYDTLRTAVGALAR